MKRRKLSTPVETLSQAEKAFIRLEELIVTLELAPGTVWTEAMLSEMLGLGRTPVREAILRLANYQLVMIVQRHGIRISDVNEREQLLMLETRRELDRLIAVRAARRSTPDEKQALLQMAQSIRRAGKKGDVAEFVRLFFLAKRFLSRCARNRFAEHAVAPLYVVSHRFYTLHHSLKDLNMVAELHADLMGAIAKGNENEAAVLSDRQIDYAEMLTRETMTREI
jgi:DNA-binding GntR family transcriptional regulator